MLREFEPRVTLPSRARPARGASKPWTVILTGSTGSVGTYLLSALLSLPPTKLDHVYCLNRNPAASAQQALSLKSRGLPYTDTTLARVSFLTIDFGASNLGLDATTWEKLVDETSFIIHNAWPVNFLLPTDAFRPHIATLTDLLRLSHSTPNGAPLLFVSSISTAVSDHWGDGHVREDVHESPEKLLPQGYARSKYVGEKLVSAFVRSTGISASVLRVGQVAGPVEGSGAWNMREWFPSLIRSAKHLGALPANLERLENVDWIPVDELAITVTQIAEMVMETTTGTEKTTKTPVFNIMNPRKTRYESLLPSLSEKLGVRVLPASDWVDLLSRSVGESGGIVSDENPAAKLLDFYREHMVISCVVDLETDVENTVTASERARNLPAVSKEWLELWLKGWSL